MEPPTNGEPTMKTTAHASAQFAVMTAGRLSSLHSSRAAAKRAAGSDGLVLSVERRTFSGEPLAIGARCADFGGQIIPA